MNELPPTTISFEEGYPTMPRASGFAEETVGGGESERLESSTTVRYKPLQRETK